LLIIQCDGHTEEQYLRKLKGEMGERLGVLVSKCSPRIRKKWPGCGGGQ